MKAIIIEQKLPCNGSGTILCDVQVLAELEAPNAAMALRASRERLAELEAEMAPATPEEQLAEQIARYEAGGTPPGARGRLKAAIVDSAGQVRLTSDRDPAKFGWPGRDDVLYPGNTFLVQHVACLATYEPGERELGYADAVLVRTYTMSDKWHRLLAEVSRRLTLEAWLDMLRHETSQEAPVLLANAIARDLWGRGNFKALGRLVNLDSTDGFRRDAGDALVGKAIAYKEFGGAREEIRVTRLVSGANPKFYRHPGATARELREVTE